MSVTASPWATSVGQVVTVTVSGTNPSMAVKLAFGEGTGQQYALDALAVSSTHTYAIPGPKTISATGMGNCGGFAATTVVIQ